MNSEAKKLVVRALKVCFKTNTHYCTVALRMPKPFNRLFLIVKNKIEQLEQELEQELEQALEQEWVFC
eukprot:2478296-Rhodomonas_salina.1